MASGRTNKGSAASFEPNEEFLEQLLQLGITKNAALKGLFYTGNYNADSAAAWVFEQDNAADINEPLTAEPINDAEDLDGSDLSEFLDPGAFYKMVFVVNAQLSMGIGKIAAQVGHAAVGLYRELCENNERFSTALSEWEQYGETKIVLKGKDANMLQEFQATAASLELATYLVQDAGHTQVDPGSMTVLGIMGKNDTVDQVTGQLSLL